MKLGVEDTVKISAARQLYGTGKARHDMKYLSGDLGEIFGLKKSPEKDGKSEDGMGAALKVLDEEIVQVQREYLAGLTDLKTLIGCTKNAGNAHYWYHPDDISAAYCAWCQQRGESEEKKGLREAKEEKERQLADLRSKLEEKQQDCAGKRERMAYFK